MILITIKTAKLKVCDIYSSYYFWTSSTRCTVLFWTLEVEFKCCQVLFSFTPFYSLHNTYVLFQILARDIRRVCDSIFLAGSTRSTGRARHFILAGKTRPCLSSVKGLGFLCWTNSKLHTPDPWPHTNHVWRSLEVLFVVKDKKNITRNKILLFAMNFFVPKEEKKFKGMFNCKIHVYFYLFWFSGYVFFSWC